MYIPTGNFVLHEGDRIHVTAPAADITSLFTSLGIVHHKVRKVMIVGGGRITVYLTRQLMEMGVDVTIIEKDAARCRVLCEYLPKATIINGDGTDRELLGEESIEDMDAFVALTGLDRAEHYRIHVRCLLRRAEGADEDRPHPLPGNLCERGH